MKIEILSLFVLFIVASTLKVDAQTTSAPSQSFNAFSIFNGVWNLFKGLINSFFPNAISDSMDTVNKFLGNASEEAKLALNYVPLLAELRMALASANSTSQEVDIINSVVNASDSEALVKFLLGDLQKYDNNAYLMLQEYTGNFSDLFQLVLPLLKMNPPNLPKSAENSTILGVVLSVSKNSGNLKDYAANNLYNYLSSIDVPNVNLMNQSECIGLTYYSFFCDYNITNLSDFLKYLYDQANGIISQYKPNTHQVQSRTTTKSSTSSTNRSPSTTIKASASTTRSPSTTIKASASTTRSPSTTIKASASTTRSPSTKIKASASTTRSPSTTAKVSASTTRLVGRK